MKEFRSFKCITGKYTNFIKDRIYKAEVMRSIGGNILGYVVVDEDGDCFTFKLNNKMFEVVS